MPRDVYRVLLRIADALERIEARVPSSVSAFSKPIKGKPSLLASAIAIALEEGLTNKAEIARRLGVHRSSLTRLPKLDPVLDNIRRHHVLK
jgi:ActR/RegA family two-component response regulator